MKMKKISMLFLGLTVLGLTVSASMPADENVMPVDTIYTLEQCRQLALANNAAIRTADNNLSAATQMRREAFTKYFPELTGGVSAFRTNHDILRYDVLHLFTLGLFDRGKAAGVWALQPVFMGGQIVNGNKLAKVGEEVARIRRQQAADQVQLQTDGLYWQLVALKAQKTTLQSVITALDSLGADVKAAVDAGLAMNNDYLKVELKRNGFKADLVDLDNGITLMKMLLAQQLGLGPERKVDVEGIIPDSVPEYPSELFINPQEALYLTDDHQLLVKNVEARNIERRMAVGKNMPQLAVGAGWFYHDAFGQNQNFAGVMVSLKVPISGWWGGSHEIKRKKLEVENARTELNDLSQKLEIEMSDKWDNLTAAHRKMVLAREAIAQSEENLRLNKIYYEAGMSTITDLLEAETLARQAKDDYIAAYGQFKLSEAGYLNSTGRSR